MRTLPAGGQSTTPQLTILGNRLKYRAAFLYYRQSLIKDTQAVCARWIRAVDVLASNFIPNSRRSALNRRTTK